MSNIKLPTAYVDSANAVADADAAAAIILFNRIPEPDETDVPTNAAIELAFVDTGLVGVSSASVTITTNAGSVVAWTKAGGFDTAYSGSTYNVISSQGSGTPDEYRLQLVSSTAWTSQDRIIIRVQVVPVSGTALDTTYSCFVEDVTKPLLASAKTQGLKTLILTFGEDVLMDSSAFGVLRVKEVSGRLTFTSPDIVQIDNAALDTTNVGDFLCVIGSERALNNDFFTVASIQATPSAVTTVEQVIVTEAPIITHRAYVGPYRLIPVMEPTRLIPTYTPCVVGAVQLDARNVQLTLDQQLSPGRNYQVQAANVGDTATPVNVQALASVAFQAENLPVVAGRDFNLWDMIPQTNKREDTSGDLERFVRCFDEVTQLLLNDIDNFATITDIDTAPSNFIGGLLSNLGNTYSFLNTDLLKRKAALSAVETAKDAGISRSIVSEIKHLLGIDVEVFPFNSNDSTWILGDSYLGATTADVDGNGNPLSSTILGTSDLFLRYSFEIVSPVVLTATQRAIITELANTWRTAHEHFVRLIEPGSNIPVIPA